MDKKEGHGLNFLGFIKYVAALFLDHAIRVVPRCEGLLSCITKASSQSQVIRGCAMNSGTLSDNRDADLDADVQKECCQYLQRCMAPEALHYLAVSDGNVDENIVRVPVKGSMACLYISPSP